MSAALSPFDEVRLAPSTRRRLVQAAAAGEGLRAEPGDEQRRILAELAESLRRVRGVRPQLLAWRVPLPGDPQRRTVDVPRLALDLGTESFSLGFEDGLLCLYAGHRDSVPVTGAAQLRRFVDEVVRAREDAQKRACKRDKIRALREHAIRAAVAEVMDGVEARHRLEFIKGKGRARLEIELGSYELAVDIPYDGHGAVIERLGELIHAARELAHKPVPFSLYRLR